MPLTAPEMETEAQAVADGICDIIVAGIDPDSSVSEKVATLLGSGLQTFGDVTAGLDQDANRVRFSLEVGAKVVDTLVSRLLPLTEEG
tara:strand:+ start:1112 stop:1375 length:264 start_codon:yes stop_codon:yes gene_type:complete